MLGLGQLECVSGVKFFRVPAHSLVDAFCLGAEGFRDPRVEQHPLVTDQEHVGAVDARTDRVDLVRGWAHGWLLV